LVVLSKSHSHLTSEIESVDNAMAFGRRHHHVLRHPAPQVTNNSIFPLNVMGTMSNGA
jgi:hypothetical protein